MSRLVLIFYVNPVTTAFQLKLRRKGARGVGVFLLDSKYGCHSFYILTLSMGTFVFDP